MRLNKYISHSGYCSRRDADQLIEQGFVKVNGTVMTTPYIVKESDIVLVKDQPILEKPKRKIWIYYKPVGLITTHRDEKNRPTVFDEEHIKKLGRVISVGRLDLNSEGLLLLTNDPDFAHMAEKPSNKLKRVYKVRVFGDLDYQQLDALKHGLTIDGMHYGSIHIECNEQTAKNSWILVTLTEGKNREIRKVLNHVGLEVNRLIRVSFGEFELGDLKPGEVKLVK
ncbi:MAG: rRNA pseudouridine synthase [Proteobacteria bacterium]|nr:rRNA pseudouridine synthase [Pseudomonadota bacterium]